MKTTITYACLNALGSFRQNNEDNFFVQGKLRSGDKDKDIFCQGSFSSGNVLVGVFDGMGGESCGEVAPHIAAAVMAETHLPEEDPAAEVVEFCKYLNGEVCSYAVRNGIPSMGSTLCGIWFRRKQCHIFHLGDSRVYLFRKKTLTRLTQDHSAPAIGTRKGPLLQYLGLPEEVYALNPGQTELPYRNGDQLLICSDGLTDMVTDDEIAEVLGTDEAPEGYVRKLYERAMNNGGRDNITIMLCRVRRSFF